LKATAAEQPKFGIIFTTIYICDKGEEEPEFFTTLGRTYSEKNLGELDALRVCLTSATQRRLSSKSVPLAFQGTGDGVKAKRDFQDILRGGRTKSYWDMFARNFADKYHREDNSRSGAIFFSLFVLGRYTHFAILRFDFEASVIQLIRKRSKLSAISDAIVPENVKKSFVYPYVERRTGRIDFGKAMLFENNYSEYFPRFCGLVRIPTGKEIAKELRATTTAPQTEFQSLVAGLSKHVSAVAVPFVSPREMVVDIDDVEIRFRIDEYAKKVHLCEYGDRKVALVVGSTIVPRYAGQPLTSPDTQVRAKRVDDLNTIPI